MNNARFLVCIAILSSLALAQQQLPPEDRINGPETLKAFKTARSVVEKSAVKVLNGEGLQLAWATAVDTDLVLTKASALLDATGVVVELPDGKRVKPKRMPRPNRNDLVLFKLPGAKLTAVTFVPSEKIEQGTWLVSSSSTKSKLMAGVLAADRRTIKRDTGVIGVYLGEDGKDVGGVKIRSIAPQGGAEAAGLQAGDVITEVNGVEILKVDVLKAQLGKLEPGAMVAVTVLRDKESMDFKVRLGHRGQVFGLFNTTQKLSGVTSVRKTGYEGVLQHDIPLPANEMGGPMLTVKGECIGINIARINRTENFALPSEIVEAFLTATEEPPAIAAVDEPKSDDPAVDDPGSDEPKPSDPPSIADIEKMVDPPSTAPPEVKPEPLPRPTPNRVPAPAAAAKADVVKDPMLDVDGDVIPAYELIP